MYKNIIAMFLISLININLLADGDIETSDFGLITAEHQKEIDAFQKKFNYLKVKQKIASQKRSIDNPMNMFDAETKLIMGTYADESELKKRFTVLVPLDKMKYLQSLVTGEGTDNMCPTYFTLFGTKKNEGENNKLKIINESALKHVKDSLTDDKVKLYCGALKNTKENYFELNPHYSSDTTCSMLNKPKEELNEKELSLLENDMVNVYKYKINNKEIGFCKIKRNTEYLYSSSKCKISVDSLMSTSTDSYQKKVINEFTAEKCCNNPSETVELGMSLGVPKVKCRGFKTKKLSYTKLSKQKQEYSSPLAISCDGISYNGFLEQYVIDVLEDYRDIFVTTMKPYTSCCSTGMSELQKWALRYANLFCLPKLAETMVTGVWDGQKIGKGSPEMSASCTHHLSNFTVKGGGMFNGSLMNMGVRATTDFSGTIKYAGCMMRQLKESHVIDLYEQCLLEKEKEFYEIIEEIVNMNLELNLGYELYEVKNCESILDDPSTLEFGLDPEMIKANKNPFYAKYEDSDTETSLFGGEVVSGEIPDGKNFLGIIKNGEEYLPSVQKQELLAFYKTNCMLSSYYVGDCKEKPIMLYSNIIKNIYLKNKNYEDKALNNNTNVCYEDSKTKIINRLESVIKTIGEVRTINPYIYIYSNNIFKVGDDNFIDSGYLSSKCNSKQKEEIRKNFNKILKNYITEYLGNLETTNDLRKADIEKTRFELEWTYLKKFKNQITPLIVEETKLEEQEGRLYYLISKENKKEEIKNKEKELKAIKERKQSIFRKIIKIKLAAKKLLLKQKIRKKIEEEVDKKIEQIKTTVSQKESPEKNIYDNINVYQFIGNQKINNDFYNIKQMKEVMGL